MNTRYLINRKSGMPGHVNFDAGTARGTELTSQRAVGP